MRDAERAALGRVKEELRKENEEVGRGACTLACAFLRLKLLHNRFDGFALAVVCPQAQT